MTKNYNLQQSPNTIGYASPEFTKGAFDAAIVQKGYKIYQERAISCPCCNTQGHATPSCPYCGGTGYFYIEPTETIALITGVNVNTKYKEWTLDNAGTIALTTFDEGLNFSFFDKITFKEKYGIFSESKRVRVNAGEKFVWLSFKPVRILKVFTMNVAGIMIELPQSDYVVDGDYRLKLLNPGINTESVVSVYYKHYIQYNVIDLPHELRASNITDENGNLQKIDLPVQAIARRSNFVFNENSNNQEIWQP